MITTILIDDEEAALDSLEWQIKTYCKQLTILKKVNAPDKAITIVKSLMPDCIFLDINMPFLDGFDVLKCLTHQPFQTIFTTAHEKYALKAIKASAFDYLLKPIDKYDLIDAVVKLEQQLGNMQGQKKQNNNRQKIKIQVDGSVHFFSPKEVIFLKAESNYTTIHLTNGRKFTLCKTLKEVEKEFEDPTFLRTHKSFVINLNHVQEYKKCDGGSIIMSNGQHTGISRMKKELFFDLMR